jgi:hypothetical protein
MILQQNTKAIGQSHFLISMKAFKVNLETEFEKIYAKQKKEIVANLEDDPKKNPFDEMKWIEVMQESLTSFYKKAISKAGKDTQEEIMRRANRLLQRSVKQTPDIDYSYSFDDESDSILAFIADQRRCLSLNFLVGHKHKKLES